MRSESLSANSRGRRGSESALLDALEDTYVPKSRRTRPPEPSPRSFAEDFPPRLPDQAEDDGFDYRNQGNGYRIRFRGRILQLPKTLRGRIAGGIGVLVFAGFLAGGVVALRNFFLHDSRFVISSSSSIQITGNTHISRAQLLSVFGEDVEHNIFNVPLAERQTELEQLPWVAHATVMRLLPNHLRIAVSERTPVAFVRQGNQIGMVDANGVLLDIPSDAPGDPGYSFPVVTGVNQGDPLSTRAARMKLYADFTRDLNTGGDNIPLKLSEVDLSNPEDVKALIPEGPTDILVHFGDAEFLTRYQRFEQHLAEWRNQYPKLAAVDMRYERQVVLDMQRETSAPIAAAVASPKTAAKASSTAPATKPKATSAKPPAKPAALTGPSAAASANTSEEWHMVVVKPHTKGAAQPAKPLHPSQAAPQ